MGPDPHGGLRIWRDRDHELPRAPGRYRYARLAGLCIAILGAAVGIAYPGVARWVIWGSTAVVSMTLLCVGERGVQKWQADFSADASPEEVFSHTDLKRLNRFQAEYLAAAIAAFILVLFIPVSSLVRFAIFCGLVSILGTAFGAIRGRSRAGR